jgi:hypothetical protein
MDDTTKPTSAGKQRTRSRTKTDRRKIPQWTGSRSPSTVTHLPQKWAPASVNPGGKPNHSARTNLGAGEKCPARACEIYRPKRTKNRSWAAGTEPKNELPEPIMDNELKTEAERIEQRKPTKTSPRAENKRNRAATRHTTNKNLRSWEVIYKM